MSAALVVMAFLRGSNPDYQENGAGLQRSFGVALAARSD
jgi:hypothetical protein